MFISERSSSVVEYLPGPRIQHSQMNHDSRIFDAMCNIFASWMGNSTTSILDLLRDREVVLHSPVHFVEPGWTEGTSVPGPSECAGET